MSLIDISGRTFGAWTALVTAPRPDGETQQGAFWRCRCTCGNEAVLSGIRLRAGRLKRGCDSCAGHGHTRGIKMSPTYQSWRGMRERCLRPDNRQFAYYGGRGITVCDRWRDSFKNFLGDMGARPSGRTLDRIDVNGHYEPDNCRWATAKEQAQNSAHCKLTDEQVCAVRRAAAAGITAGDIALLTGVTRGHIAGIIAGLARSPEIGGA